MRRISISPQDPKIKVGEKTFDEIDVIKSSIRHEEEVVCLFKSFVDHGINQVLEHDHTKSENLRMFTEALQTDFKDDSLRGKNWFKDIHVKEERHHLNDYVPDDVNLIDVLEMLCDCVCAAKARSGKITKPIQIDSDTLQKALVNTVKLLDESTYILEDD